MKLEEQRFLHEDLERLEQGIADRMLDEPRHMRDRLSRDHQVARFLDRMTDQSRRLLDIYNDADGARSQEIQAVGSGEPLEHFYKQLGEIKAFHARYPNEPVENLERAYKKDSAAGEAEATLAEIENMFTGEEAFGKFLDLTTVHEAYLNLPNIKRPTYLHYLDTFDTFVPPQCTIKRADKMTDQYFSYLGSLAEYLQDFLRRTRPLDNLDLLFTTVDEDFAKAWEKGEVSGWSAEAATSAIGPASDGVWCADCEKVFKNDNVFKAHLGGKKHIRAAEQRAPQAGTTQNGSNGHSTTGNDPVRLKERAIAEREYRIQRTAAAMSQERSDTRVNVERKQGMTERERQQELDALFNSDEASGNVGRPAGGGGGDSDSDSDGEDKIYNPLKLPLAWDGKPIPFWLYKLHGLGVEFKCEICGNYVYMGRRAFDKHFTEARHAYGLKCLGIASQTALFREITDIESALRLWEKLQAEKKREKANEGGVVQMEDAEGNVMPEKVYYDLQKQGLL